MKLGAIFEKRGEITEKFIGIEGCMDTVISHHYFKEYNFDFVFNLLRNENSNFGLKRSLFEKIINNFDKKNEVMKGIHRLNKIRNIFSHSLSKAAGQDGDVFFGNPKLGGEDLNVDDLYNEFLRVHIDTLNLMFSLGKEYGLNDEVQLK